MIKNNKGFAITEVLIISTVVIGVLIFMYTQFKNINRSYQYSFKYDTVEGLYLANNIVNYISDNLYDQLVEALNNSEVGYLDITECETSQIATSTFCGLLFEKSKVERVLFTEENLKQTKATMTDLTEDIQDYINQIQINDIQNDHRIIVKYQDGTYATLRFNKGNTYVQRGLIAHLDAINNTGVGHSNTTQTWVDLSGQGNDAILYNNPSWSNNSLTFDGLTNYASLENTANLTYENGTTWEVRVKVLSLTGMYNNQYIDFFGNWETGGAGIGYYQPNNFSASIYISNDYVYATSNDVSNIGEYYTVTVTYDNDILKLYVNGKLVSNVDCTNVSITPSFMPITLGGDPNRRNGEFTIYHFGNVEFQNVLIYDRALSEAEVLRNYQVDESRF